MKKVSPIHKMTKKERQTLIEETDFLLERSTLPQRLWHRDNTTKDIPKCKICQKNVKWHKNRYMNYCSSKCMGKDPDWQRKREQTWLVNYGVDNPLKSKAIQEKQKQTNLERYGVDNPSQNKEVQDKRKETFIERFGVDNPYRSTDIRAKIKEKFLQKYGVDNPFKSEEIKKIIKNTNLERYGVKSPLQSKKIQEKQRQTNLERYGVEHSAQRYYSKETKCRLNYDYLWKEYINKNKTSTQIAKELNINTHTVCVYLRKFDIPIFKIKNHSKISIQWLDSIMDKEGIYIQHAGNIGEFNIPETKLVADGYCFSTNTIYEFYGDCFHGNLNIYKEDECPHPFDPDITTLKLYNKTIEREKRIKELGYNLISIWESDYSSLVRLGSV